ncbi:Crp/Fnr family transcriptional regulator [Mucilaginibacter sp. SG564]|uniref:Crp/Fnr family transcriptional regulator n=1 Tax=Mucilaginibacter sp. SG564 TaxID=2587022 RepID=UPI0015551691|nr:Crp/Fnr family transcriptional regulator [Mucilaginibacter sp. SG564]NOW99004.1 CRP-like cAMP-binding protein [Mucilaginibacter sp. SG564]
MEEFINCLSKYSTLSGQHIELITSKAKLLNLKKGDCFLEVGRVAKQFGFVMEGVLRVCWYNEIGEDITRAFIPEYHFALNVSSFNNETPSEVCFEAIANCKLLVFSKKDMAGLANAIPGWNEILLKITATALTNKSKVSQNMLTQDATTRYLEFLKIYPGLANRIPLSALASYLGIKQSSLSRIRRKII